MYGLKPADSLLCHAIPCCAIAIRIRGQSLGYRVAEFHLDSRTVVLDARTPSDESGAAQSGPALFLYGVELNPVTYYQVWSCPELLTEYF
jgi:hypothetical protein